MSDQPMTFTFDQLAVMAAQTKKVDEASRKVRAAEKAVMEIEGANADVIERYKRAVSALSEARRVRDNAERDAVQAIGWESNR